MPQNLNLALDVKNMLAKFADRPLTVDLRGDVWANFNGKNIRVGSLETEPMGTMMAANLLTLDTNNVRELYSGSNGAQQGTFAFTSMSKGTNYSMAIDQRCGMRAMIKSSVDINDVKTLRIQPYGIVALKA